MRKIAKIFVLRGGIQKVEFCRLSIYRLLKEKHGYRYCKINGRGYYLQLANDGSIRKVEFSDLKECFVELLENKFEDFDLSMDQETILDEFYRQRPIKNGHFARTYLGIDFNITEFQIQEIGKQ